MAGKFVSVFGLFIAALLLGVPAAEIVVHGFNFSLWPDNVVHPSGLVCGVDKNLRPETC